MWLIYSIKIININCKAAKNLKFKWNLYIKVNPIFYPQPLTRIQVKRGSSKQSKTRFLNREANKYDTTNHSRKRSHWNSSLCCVFCQKPGEKFEMLSSNQEYVDNPHHKHNNRASDLQNLVKLEIYAVDQTYFKYFKILNFKIFTMCTHPDIPMGSP